MNFDIDKVIGTVAATAIGGVVWLFRKVMTNEKQIALLQAEIKRRSEDIKEVKGDIKRLLERK